MTKDTPSSCCLCEGDLDSLFEVALFRSVNRVLFRCETCGSCQFPRPDWLSRAYEKAISELDTGIVERSTDFANVLTSILILGGYSSGTFQDLGGGLGLLARLMRDRGFDFYSTDPLLEPVVSLPTHHLSMWTMSTMIEVFEHLIAPADVIENALQSSDNILISTLVIPKSGLKPDWWYLMLDTGQHVTFATVEGLTALANKLGVYLTTNEKNLHLLSKNRPPHSTVLLIKHQAFAWLIGYLCAPFRRRLSLINRYLQSKLEELYG